MKAFLTLLAGGVLVWFVFVRETPARWRGIPAPGEPIQKSMNLPAPFAFNHYRVTPLATYEVTAVVLSRERYRFDPAAELSPLDLALGWGPMSIASAINELKISQSGRWYEYTYHGDPPLDPDTIATHSANTHCIPADTTVRRALLGIRRHEQVTLTGYLVEISGPNGMTWRSSLTRDDTGGHACEVMWVTHVEHHPIQVAASQPSHLSN
jgi:hypothetical protein